MEEKKDKVRIRKGSGQARKVSGLGKVERSGQAKKVRLRFRELQPSVSWSQCGMPAVYQPSTL